MDQFSITNIPPAKLLKGLTEQNITLQHASSKDTFACQLPEGVDVVSDEDIYKPLPIGSFITRTSIASNNQKANFEISTKQGDKVTLTYERSELEVNYLRPTGWSIPGLPAVDKSEISFSMTIQGDLDEQEKADIKAFQKEVTSIIEDFLSCETNAMGSEEFDMSRYKALNNYGFSIDYATSSSFASGMVKGYFNPDNQDQTDHRLSGTTLLISDNKQTDPESAVQETQTASPELSHSSGLFSYNDKGKTSNPNNTQKNISPSDEFSKLGKATEEVFNKFNGLDYKPHQEHIEILNKDFLNLITMLENLDNLKACLDELA